MQRESGPNREDMEVTRVEPSFMLSPCGLARFRHVGAQAHDLAYVWKFFALP